VLCESCSKHLLDQEDVDMVNPVDKEKGVTLEDFKLIKMHMSNCMYSHFYLYAYLQFRCLDRGFWRVKFICLN